MSREVGLRTGWISRESESLLWLWRTGDYVEEYLDGEFFHGGC